MQVDNYFVLNILREDNHKDLIHHFIKRLPSPRRPLDHPC